MSIQNASMLIDLNISTWTGRKLDKRVSEEIDHAKGTKVKAGNYNKQLLAGADKLAEVQKIVGQIRTWHYEQTLPWSDGGSRLLPMKNFFDYKNTLASLEQEFEAAVRDFLQEYPQLVSNSAFALGALFDRGEYPDVEDIEHKFKFRYAFMPLPEAGDFRVDCGDSVKQELEAQYKEFYDNKLKEAMTDMWDRLHETLTHMSDKLANSEQPRKLKNGEEVHTKIFRDSMVENAVELCGLLTKLNVSNDTQLELARQKLEKAIHGVDAKTLRDSDEVRLSVKKQVDDILSAFNF